MALINFKELKRIDKERNSIHTEVKSTYTSFINKEGIKFFQIDTYGSEEFGP